MWLLYIYSTCCMWFYSPCCICLPVVHLATAQLRPWPPWHYPWPSWDPRCPSQGTILYKEIILYYMPAISHQTVKHQNNTICLTVAHLDTYILCKIFYTLLKMSAELSFYNMSTYFLRLYYNLTNHRPNKIRIRVYNKIERKNITVIP